MGLWIPVKVSSGWIELHLKSTLVQLLHEPSLSSNEFQFFFITQNDMCITLQCILFNLNLE
jgi:hypothetical protein